MTTARTAARTAAASRARRGETPTEEARRIANFFLTMLPHDVQTQQIQRAQVAGYTWVGVATITVTGDDVLRPGDAARLVHVTTATLRKWVQARILSRTGSGYRVDDLYEAQATMVERRMTRRRSAA